MEDKRGEVYKECKKDIARLFEMEKGVIIPDYLQRRYERSKFSSVENVPYLNSHFPLDVGVFYSN